MEKLQRNCEELAEVLYQLQRNYDYAMILHKLRMHFSQLTSYAQPHWHFSKTGIKMQVQCPELCIKTVSN
ncbi:hypothetical protein [Acinetobacter variabilis]|uniref:hypothetical protein n=1 Tax=Acinetobacter variabilis TaxID=70346 RepID=UPI0021C1036A|nr:hypothetical protein [Acinetobacter variabilis]UXI51409.1 hypothetical protein N5980_15135 [Acinetobacter variabilis]